MKGEGRWQVCLFLSVALFVSGIEAYSGRAGTCKAGRSLGRASGYRHGSNGQGELSDGTLSVSIGNVDLTANEATTVAANKELRLELNGRQSFKGFLIRLGPKGGDDGDSVNVDASGSLRLLEDEMLAQKLPSDGEMDGLSSSCASNVAGISHLSAQVKSSVAVQFHYPVPQDVELTLDVTVVIENSAEGSDAWYFSTFDLAVRYEGGTEKPPGINPNPTHKPTQLRPPPTFVQSFEPRSAGDASVGSPSSGDRIPSSPTLIALPASPAGVTSKLPPPFPNGDSFADSFFHGFSLFSFRSVFPEDILKEPIPPTGVIHIHPRPMAPPPAPVAPFAPLAALPSPSPLLPVDNGSSSTRDEPTTAIDRETDDSASVEHTPAPVPSMFNSEADNKDPRDSDEDRIGEPDGTAPSVDDSTTEPTTTDTTTTQTAEASSALSTKHRRLIGIAAVLVLTGLMIGVILLGFWGLVKARKATMTSFQQNEETSPTLALSLN